MPLETIEEYRHSHALKLDLEMTPFPRTLFPVGILKRSCYLKCSHGDMRMVHNLLIVEPCSVHLREKFCKL